MPVVVQPVLTLASFQNKTFNWTFAKVDGTDVVPTEQNLRVLNQSTNQYTSYDVKDANGNLSLTATSYSLPMALSSSSSYLVSLEQIVNGTPYTTYLSNTIALQAVPPAATITSIVGTATAITVNFTIPANSTVTQVEYLLSNKLNTQTILKPLPTGVSNTYSQVLTSTDSSMITDDATLFVAVALINTVGDGDVSNSQQVFIGGSPNAPSITSVSGLGSSAVMSWTAPSDLQYYTSDAALKMEIYDTNSNSTIALLNLTSNPQQTSYIMTNLPIAQYVFKIRYINSYGNGAWSATYSFTMKSAPSVVKNLSSVAANGLLTLSWEVPANDGGAPITGYNVIDYTGATVATLSASALQYAISNLTNGTAYTYSVQATNGQVGFSTSITDTPFTSPSSVQNLNAVVSNQSVKLVWNAPSSLGGLTGVSYSVAYIQSNAPAGTLPTTLPLTTSTSQTVSNLVNGTSYVFTVNAVVGKKDTKGAAITITATPANQPSYVSASITNPTVSVTVNPNGSSITSYVTFAFFNSGKVSYKMTTVSSGNSAYNVSLSQVQLTCDFSSDSNINSTTDTLTSWIMVANNAVGSSGIMTNIGR